MPPIIIAKNNSGSDIAIKDLGVTITDTNQLTLTSSFSLDMIFDSSHLRSYVSSGQLIINDGTSDLSVGNGLNHITIDTKWMDDSTEQIFNDHLNGGINKHDANEIDIEGTYSNISGTPTDLESTISSINTKLGTITTHTLDVAYDGTGSGNGRTITVDSGPVKLDVNSATTAPIELVPKAALPSTGLAAGQLAIKNDILCIYDGTRSKWLSVARIMLAFGRKGNTSNQYLGYYGDDDFPSSKSGMRMSRNATIVSMSGQIDVSGTCTFRLRKNNTVTDIASLTLSSVVGNTDTSLNVDVSANDILNMYLESSSVSYPLILVELAWRV